MRKFLWLSVASMVFLGAAPQQQVDAMAKLHWLAGRWQGAGSVQTPSGLRNFMQTENVQMKLGSSVMLIEGNGRDRATDKAIFSALAIVSVDEETGKYRFRAFNDGHYVDAEALVGTNSLQWGFKPPGAPITVRFTITRTSTGNWFEIGENSSDGQTWRKFFEMTVRKVAPISATPSRSPL